jgi:hypothetical protein
MQIITMDKNTTLEEITDYLGCHPRTQIKITNGSETLTWVRINDEKGFMKAVKILETGKVINAKYWKNA